eukprot:TRINITY_DN964_c0_g1_i2.p1 TRINITY_DN964_c0_g1~~TRINITY_DN964_c0_g1_i2.p1  ORF type:complete len:620 (-),score=149.75 TRINITY_DN964_c0_g1_i2:58-1917(-)
MSALTSSSRSMHSSTRDNMKPFRKGKLKKKSGWGSWKDAWFVLDNGMLLEFKSEGSNKPVRVLTLSKMSIKLAETFTGTPNTFGLFSSQRDSIYFQANSEPEMIEWVTAIGTYCMNSELEWKVDSVLEAMNDAMVISNNTGTIIGVNEAALRMFGYSRGEMMGQNVSVLMPSEIASVHDTYIQRFNETNEKRLIGKPRKMTALRKGGAPFLIELSLGVIPSAEGTKFAARLRYETNRASSGSSLNFEEVLEKSVGIVMQKAGEELKSLLLTEIEELTVQLEQTKLANQKLKSKLRTAKKSLQENKKLSNGEEGSKLMVSLDLEKIQVNERLARVGGSGAVVHLATVDGWQCAMKELELTGISTAMVERFESEILLLESLPPHRNLVRYLFHQKTKNKLRLFMTRYSCDLASFIRDRKEESLQYGMGVGAPGGIGIPQTKTSFSANSGVRLFSAKEIIKFALDIVSGLQVLHEMKIMHRDMKSDNVFVLLNEKGEIDSLSVGDFDTAKQLMDENSASTIIGTPGYIAPEVFSRDSYTYAADIWSFGMVLYEIITLQRPPTEEGFFNDSASAAKKIFESLRLSSDYKGPITLMKDCLQTVPEKRPSLEQVKERLLKLMLKS